MKFGKNMKSHMVKGWYYIDYDMLKKLIKERTTVSSESSLSILETEFLSKIKSQIQDANTFFLEKEHTIDSIKSKLIKGNAVVDDQSSLSRMLTTLCRWVVLNYLAVLKICKKYQKYGGDKEVTDRVVQIVKSELFRSRFFQSLKDSSLFASVGNLLQKFQKNENQIWYDVKCPLCLQVMTSGNASLTCGHNFCWQCLAKCVASKSTSCPVCNTKTDVAAPVNLEICQIIGSFSNHYFPIWKVGTKEDKMIGMNTTSTSSSSSSSSNAKGKMTESSVRKEDIIADAYRLIALHRASAKMKLVHSSNGILMVTDSFSPPSTPTSSTAKRSRTKRKRQFGSIRCSKCNKFGILEECCEGATYHVVIRVKR